MVDSDLTKRYGQLPHWQMGGSVYFVTFRSSRGTLPAEALRLVANAIRYEHSRRYHLYLGVLMPDHVHLIVQPLEQQPGCWHNISTIMKSIKGISARRINLLQNTTGNVWQSEYFDRIVRDQDELLGKWNYILNNPVKAGIVADHQLYEFIIQGEE